MRLSSPSREVADVLVLDLKVERTAAVPWLVRGQMRHFQFACAVSYPTFPGSVRQRLSDRATLNFEPDRTTGIGGRTDTMHKFDLTPLDLKPSWILLQ